MGLTSWDPNEHPRDPLGKFKSLVGALEMGGKAKLPDGPAVRRTHTPTGESNAAAGAPAYRVSATGHFTGTHLRHAPGYDSPEAAAKAALDYSARNEHPKSYGGRAQFKSMESASDAFKTGKVSDKHFHPARGQDLGAAQRELDRLNPNTTDRAAQKATSDKTVNSKIDAIAGRGSAFSHAPEKLPNGTTIHRLDNGNWEVDGKTVGPGKERAKDVARRAERSKINDKSRGVGADKRSKERTPREVKDLNSLSKDERQIYDSWEKAGKSHDEAMGNALQGFRTESEVRKRANDGNRRRKKEADAKVAARDKRTADQEHWRKADRTLRDLKPGEEKTLPNGTKVKLGSGQFSSGNYYVDGKRVGTERGRASNVAADAEKAAASPRSTSAAKNVHGTKLPKIDSSRAQREIDRRKVNSRDYPGEIPAGLKHLVGQKADSDMNGVPTDTLMEIVAQASERRRQARAHKGI